MSRLTRIQNEILAAMKRPEWPVMDDETRAAAIAMQIDSLWHSLNDPSIDADDWPGPPEDEDARAASHYGGAE